MMGPNPHHGEPLCDPDATDQGRDPHGPVSSRTRGSGAGSCSVAAHIASESVATIFHGRPVHRLSDELQLVYVASYWIRDLTAQAIHPSLVAPLLDAVTLLRYLGPDAGLGSSPVVARQRPGHRGPLHHARLACATRSRRAAAEVLTALRNRQQIIAGPELRVIDWLIDNYLVGGRPFTLLQQLAPLAQSPRAGLTLREAAAAALAHRVPAELSTSLRPASPGRAPGALAQGFV